MALITCTFSSKILQKSTQFNAVIPRGKEKDAPVLYLLHGLGDDYTAWSRYTAIERYANEAGIVVIMPDGGRGFYTDMVYGSAYYSFFAKEFFDYVSSLFSVARDRGRTFIAGNSMGGYGAIKLALLHPERFGAAASLSGAVNISARLAQDPRWSEVKRLVFGDQNTVENTENDLFYLIKNTIISNNTPRLYIACGEDDFLYQNNVIFTNELSKTLIPHKFHVAPGVHDWIFWDNQIRLAIDFFLTGN